MSSKLKEECGVFGVFNHPKAADLTYYGLHALQHRGQESAGIVASNGKTFKHHRGMGLVTQVFTRNILDGLKGNMAIGHVRYSTSGESLLQNAQPLVFKYIEGETCGIPISALCNVMLRASKKPNKRQAKTA